MAAWSATLFEGENSQVLELGPEILHTSAMASAISEDLPIRAYLPEISRLVLEEGALVLSAAPGAGKTSLVPPAIAEAIGAPRGGKVLVMEPRRVAAIAAAARVAQIWKREPGFEVGYRVRGDSRCPPRAAIEFVTPGILVRELQDPSALAGIGCVVLDEFHERSVDADLAFALLARARASLSGPRALIMSATMDALPVARALGAAVLEVPGMAFPVETRYVPLAANSRTGAGLAGAGFERELARSALELSGSVLEPADEGDVLVFLPGAAEIARAVSAFEDLARAQVAEGARPRAFALHGSLPLEAQRRILSPEPGSPPRVIFATSIAETSLTVPRVRAVLDSGLARLPRFQARIGLNRLVTEREARDRADQRRGRAGRLGPGLCVRAWSAAEALAERTECELRRAELSALALESAIAGAPRRLDLPWLEAPPEAPWGAAVELLAELGAIAADGSATALGRRMASLGTEPRLAALALRGLEEGEGWTACLAAALLSVGGAGPKIAGGDLASAMETAATDTSGDFAPIMTEARRLAAAAGTSPARARPECLPALLAAAFPDRVAQRWEFRGSSSSFRIPAGRSLRASGPLASSPWIVALDADAGASEGKVYSGIALTEAEALVVLGRASVEEPEVEWKGLEPRLSLVLRSRAIVLKARPLPRPGREQLAALLAARLAAEGLGLLPWDDQAKRALARLRFFAARFSRRGDDFLDPASLSDEALCAAAQSWLGPFLLERGPAIDTGALKRAVESLVPRPLRRELDRLAPALLELPSGTSRPIDYGWPGGPSVEARVQEFYGLRSHPCVLGQPLSLRLLDPGGKPLQVSSDLPGFWKGSWSEARKALRGRYPKHEWPEDPSAAAPSRSGIKARRDGSGR